MIILLRRWISHGHYMTSPLEATRPDVGDTEGLFPPLYPFPLNFARLQCFALHVLRSRSFRIRKPEATMQAETAVEQRYLFYSYLHTAQ